MSNIGYEMMGEITHAAENLADELAQTRKVRDEWCAEYTRVRDELEAVKKDLEFYRKHYGGFC